MQNGTVLLERKQSGKDSLQDQQHMQGPYNMQKIEGPVYVFHSFFQLKFEIIMDTLKYSSSVLTERYLYLLYDGFFPSHLHQDILTTNITNPLRTEHTSARLYPTCRRIHITSQGFWHNTKMHIISTSFYSQVSVCIGPYHGYHSNTLLVTKPNMSLCL